MEFEVQSFNIKEISAKLQKNRTKPFRKIIQWGMAEWLSEVRYNAKENFIPNRTGTRIPWIAARLQPPHPKLVTIRSRALQAMVMEGGGDWKREWGSAKFGNRQLNTNRNVMQSFNGRIVLKGDSDYEGWWSGYIRPNSVGYRIIKPIYRKKDFEGLTDQLYWRTLHEIGTSKFPARPYIKPSAEKREYLLQQYILRRFNKVRRLFE